MRTTPLNGLAANAVRQIMLTLVAKKVRVIAVAAPKERTSRAFALTLCSEFAAAGFTTVHLALDPNAPDLPHAPNLDGSKPLAVAARSDDVASPVPEWWPSAPPDMLAARTPNKGLLRLRAPTDLEHVQSFNNPAAFRIALDRAFASAQIIIMELAPVLLAELETVSCVAAAAASDGVVLLCPLNVSTRQDIRLAEATLKAAGARIIGTVLDETGSVPALVELAGALDRWRGYAPSWIAPLQSWLKSSASAARP